MFQFFLQKHKKIEHTEDDEEEEEEEEEKEISDLQVKDHVP